MRILAVTPEPPFPPDQGGRIRMHNLLKRLSQKHEVHLVTVTDGTIKPEIITVLQENYTSVSFLDFPRSKSYMVRCLVQSLILRKPYLVYKNTPPDLKTFLEAKIQECTPDILLLDFHYFVDATSSLKIPKVVILHNLDHISYLRFAAEPGFSTKKWHGRMQAPLSIHLEKKVPKLFDYCVTVSKNEEQMLREISGAANIRVIPNGVDTNFFTPDYQPANLSPDCHADLVFFGTMDYYPNIDGANFLIEQIMPIVWSKKPHVILNIVGRNPGNKMRGFARDARIRVIGEVDDIRPYIAGAKAVVVPLRMGGGTRLKALEAASMGKAIIGTSIGLEGLDFVHKVHAIVVDTPNELAEQILLCLDSESTRISLGFEARKFVEENNSWDFCAGLLEDVLGRIMLNRMD